MPSSEDLKQARQLERLKYIDLCAYVLGYVNRKFIMDRFDVSGAYASRDIVEYQRRYDERLKMDNRLKRYVQASYFLPVFQHDVKEALDLVEKGTFTKTCLVNNRQGLTSEMAPTIYPKLEIIAPLLVALCSKNKVEVVYFSRSSGKTQRLLVPHSLFASGHFYYVRAFDHKSGEFRSFKLNRFVECHLVQASIVATMEKVNDIDWNTKLKVTIGINPNTSHPETIEYDYGVFNGIKELTVSKALLPYCLTEWNIASKDYANLPPELFPLTVLDTKEL